MDAKQRQVMEENDRDRAESRERERIRRNATVETRLQAQAKIRDVLAVLCVEDQIAVLQAYAVSLGVGLKAA